MRCFIGIFPPRSVREEILRVKKSMESLPMKCKFVEPENYHISVSFLGEISENVLNEIKKKLEKICENFPKFNVRLNKIVFIPTEKYFRVIAFDVSDGKDFLIKLSKDVKKTIGGDTKPPHLTICRVKKVEKKEDVLNKLKNIEVDINFLAESVCIVKSELSRKGPKYTVMKKIEFKGQFLQF